MDALIGGVLLTSPIWLMGLAILAEKVCNKV